MDKNWWYAAGFFLSLSMLVYILGSCSTLNNMFNQFEDIPNDHAIILTTLMPE